MRKLRLLDLFSGIGGFSKGIQEAGVPVAWHGFSEIDKYAKSVYKRHFPEAEDLGDVRGIEIKKITGDGLLRENPAGDLPNNNGNQLLQECGQSTLDNNWNGENGSDPITAVRTTAGTFSFPGCIDLITFGFPCQDLSVAGKRGGLEASRSGLFFEAMRIIRVAKPSYFVFENVKGLFSSNGGRDFITVLREVADAGYDGQWQLINTRWFLPQNRERIYFVGYPRDGRTRKIFPIGETNPVHTGQRIEDNSPKCVNCLDSNYHKGWLDHGQRTMIQVGNVDTKGNNSIWGRVYSPEGCSATLTDGGGLGAKTGLYAVSVLAPDRPEKRQNGRRFKEDGDPMFTLTGQDKHGVMVAEAQNARIRRLTPTECERLQGFPDGWTKYGEDGEEISDTQRYRQLGNAVSVPVVKAVMTKLKEISNL
jgi:DNA (cytosine-5)-methyltransferase 1